MPRYNKVHIKKVHPKIWSELNDILNYFPAKISSKEYEIIDQTFDVIKGGSSLKLKGKDAFYLHNQPSENFMTAIPDKLNRILEEEESLAEYLIKDYESRTQHYKGRKTLPFDRIPIGKLVIPWSAEDLPVLESYSRRRAINSLLTLFASTNPEFAFSNQMFLDGLRGRLDRKKSLFSQAIRIEPSLLQARVGLSILEWWPLWKRSGIHALGVALRPEGKAKIENDFEVSTHTTVLAKALLILKILAPESSAKLTDRELMDLLSAKKHGLCPKNYDIGAFKKVRLKIFKKKGKK